MLNEDVKRIKDYLKENKITYDDLSKMSGIPISTLNYIFTGRTTNPRMDTLKAIECALGIQDTKSLSDSIIDHINELNIEDYSNLTEDERRKIAEIFNVTVSAYKKNK